MWKDIRPAEALQRIDLRSPPPDACNGGQTGQHVRIGQVCQSRIIKPAHCQGLRIADFGARQAQARQLRPSGLRHGGLIA